MTTPTPIPKPRAWLAVWPATQAPRVLNKHRDTIPDGAVFIGRPSPWGNPFKIGPDGTRAQVIERYRAMICDDPAMQERARRELGGRDLVCFCAPEPCHGDVLLQIANPAPPKLRCRVMDGPLLALEMDGPFAPRLTLKQREAIKWLKEREGWEVDLSPAPLATVYERFRLSPGWWDDAAAWAEFSRVDQDPEYREQVRADIERRRAIAAEAKDWREALGKLAEAGEVVMWKGRAA